MSAADNGGQAFPMLERSYEDRHTENTIHVTTGGMTLRDYFAAKAMPSLISGAPPFDSSNGNIVAEIAHDAYVFADAMLKAREL